MSQTKHIEKTPLDDEVIFVSPEGIKSLETAIEHIEYVYKELGKASKKDAQIMAK
jgi:homoserine trans-succinylase